MTFVYVLRSRSREVYELRRDRSRRGKPITRDEAEELISLLGTTRVMRITFNDGRSYATPLGYGFPRSSLRGSGDRQPLTF